MTRPLASRSVESAPELQPINGDSPFVPLRIAVLERLRTAILDGTLWPGMCLSENRLAAQLSVSRTPVREALRVLENENLVAILPGRKLVVAMPSRRDIDEIYGIRILVEPEALRHIQPSDTEILQRLENSIARSVEDLKNSGSRALTHPENDFHLVLISRLENRRLEEFVHSVYGFVTRFRYLSLEGLAQRAVDDHVEIVEFLKAGRTEDAITVLKEHIMRSRENLLKRFAQIPQPAHESR